jgi:hypothetical protein
MQYVAVLKGKMGPEVTDNLPVIKGSKAAIAVTKSLLQTSTACIHYLEHFVYIGNGEFFDVEVRVGVGGGPEWEFDYVTGGVFVERFDHNTAQPVKKFAVSMITQKFPNILYEDNHKIAHYLCGLMETEEDLDNTPSKKYGFEFLPTFFNYFLPRTVQKINKLLFSSNRHWN